MTTREQAIAGQICMTPGPCDDCGEAFRSCMVTDEVWRATGLPDHGALLCLPCLQARIGRELVAADFLDCEANAWFTT